MAYDHDLADRVREALVDVPHVTEKEMFTGIAFMVNGKMCINVSHDSLMCRIDPALTDELLEREYTSPMMKGKTPMKGYVYVSPEGFRTKKKFDYWVRLCLEFNPLAKSSKEKKRKK
ncbi:MAG: TfoX/Sxy family protein [Bacteroidetes bacterium]|nr:TfoX/Sxy family protein [Bacteroidota bacterium]